MNKFCTFGKGDRLLLDSNKHQDSMLLLPEISIPQVNYFRCGFGRSVSGDDEEDAEKIWW